MNAHASAPRFLEPRHLELLREIAARRTLAAVARATHRTPSALSQQLRTAERELGVKLVEPDSRGVRLTPAGQLLAEGADEVISSLARVQARLDAATGAPRGQVSIGTLPSAGQVLLPQLLHRLRDTAITVSLDDFDIAEADFAARALDADIVISHSLSGEVPRGAEGLISTVLAREPIDVVLPADHRLAAQAQLRPQDVVDHEWIGVPEGYPFDAIPVAVEQLTGRPVHRALRLRDNHLLEALVGAGAGIGLLPRFSTRPAPGVVLRPLVGVSAARAIVALSRPDRYERLAVRTVTDHLVGIGAELMETYAAT
ncbi:LysR family transcriptional regulator [Nesterenkonia aurantiaca]|uniref:DNA-binding transcriptional LysR family regulator n=1 Tax=Nesterenkonia aurantiaca TaxID=1436010 RepID=A0A4R7FVB1_9MICC|nr:LysR family transcriptional regulator [Nesterenkonia aurantiaca]TDS82641.1 DNA-binding transcriptional LysR family regulator [Nesterenkonia aurantiaca]